MKTTRAVLVAVAVLAGFGAMAADAAGAISAEGLVAWWPFGECGLNDASGNGHTLSAGPEAVIGESAVLAGTEAGNANSGLSASGILFSEMNAVTVEFWIRYSTVPSWAPVLCELSVNYNDQKGRFICFDDQKTGGCIGSGVKTDPYSMIMSSSNVLAKKAGEWHHVVAVYVTGTSYSDSLRLYVDGVDVTKEDPSDNNRKSTMGVKFPDETLYFGGRGGKAAFAGEMDAMTVWSRVLTAEEVAFHYAAGRNYNPKTILTVTGAPAEVPCEQMSPAYGNTAFTNGEYVAFSAQCGLDGVGISGWRIYTNRVDSSEKVLMLSGDGASGGFTFPDETCTLEWQFSLPANPVVCITTPVEISNGEASFSCFASNGSVEDVHVLAVYGGSPASMTSTNDLGSVTAASNFDNVKISNLPPVGVLCVRLIAVGPTGEALAASPIKVGRWLEKLCYYPFGEAGYQDASGHGLDLTATGPCALDASGAVTLTPGDAKPTLHTTQNLDLSKLNSYVASCWFRTDEVSGSPVLMEQMVSGQTYQNKDGAFIIYWDTANALYQASLKTRKGSNFSVVTSDRREIEAQWHNIAVVFARKDYPDDIKVYVDGVNCSQPTTGGHKTSFESEVFTATQLWIGGRGDKTAFPGQIDEVLVAECPEGVEDAVVAQIHGEGLLVVKGELSSDSVTVEVPDGCPADQVFPPVGTTFGYGPGETVSVVAEGKAFDRWLCSVSTNGSNSAEWIPWRRLPAASGAFQHPGVPVKVSWRKKTGLVLTIW